MRVLCFLAIVALDFIGVVQILRRRVEREDDEVSRFWSREGGRW